MLEAVWRICLDEERIWVCQEVVNSVTLWQHTHVANGVHIVVGCTYAQGRFQQTVSNKLKLWWNDKLGTAQGDNQVTLVNEC